MIPYLGCKDSIASEILNCIPAAENFYDLFGGGGSITEAAYKFRENGLFGEWQKWQKFHYNEINKAVCKLVKAIWAGKFDFDYAMAQEPTKERYYAERGDLTAWGAFVSFVWSFGNKNESFVLGRNAKDNYRKYNDALKRIKRTPIMPNIAITNKDYARVRIKPNSVVYCDIPYNIKRNYYKVKFDFLRFYDWAANCRFPVYFSEYSCNDRRFELVWEKVVHLKIKVLPIGGKAIFNTERLFWNGKAVELSGGGGQ